MAEGEHTGNILTQKTGDFPNWVWLLIIGGGIAVAYFLPKILGGFTGQGQSNAAASPFPVIPQGDVPVLPGGYGVVTTPGGTLAGYGPTGSTNQQQTGTIRASTNAGYDLTHIGVPLTSQADNASSILGYIPFGTGNIQVEGLFNGPPSPQGTTTYYLVSYSGQSGYVSSYDMPSVTSQNTNFWPNGVIKQ